jgi:nucleoside permease NupC
VTISWFFNLIHHPEVNFQFLLGLIFYPFSIIIGISLRDCLLASKLIGIKVSLNEVSIYVCIFKSLFIDYYSLLPIKNSVKFVNYAMNLYPIIHFHYIYLEH